MRKLNLENNTRERLLKLEKLRVSVRSINDSLNDLQNNVGRKLPYNDELITFLEQSMNTVISIYKDSCETPKNEVKTKEESNGHKEGVCPICGSKNLEYNTKNVESNSFWYDIECEDCKTTFSECYELKFIGHENIEVVK